jgi:hypothetical protein
MTSPRIFNSGNYAYLPSVFQYSAGVMAEPGYRLEQIRFKQPVPLQKGFKAVESRLRLLGRPFTAFAHCELRSPRQFDDQGFIDFNKTYVKQLQNWGIYTPAVDSTDAINPVARTNVCPEHHGPQEVSMYAFTYSVPSTGNQTSFVISGGGDARKGPEPYKDRIIALGDVSEAGLRKKMAFVIEEMTSRLSSFGLKWSDVTKVQAYSVHNIGILVDELLSQPGLIQHGLVWHFARPPVAGLDYEMDLRGSVNELFSDD